MSACTAVATHDEEELRRFVAARRAGDAAAAARHWTALVEANLDRVCGLVDLWARGGRLSADEREDATSLALVKLWRNMVHTFEGATMGEWVNATRACVEFACRDVQRRAARAHARTAPLEEDEAGDRQLAELAREQARRAEEAGEARSFVDWALPRLEPRRRAVLELTLEGVPADEIAARLDVSMPNLYQLRSRGLRDLAKLKELYDA